MFLVYDRFSNYKEVMAYSKLKEFLVKELVKDISTSIEVGLKDIADTTLSQLQKVAVGMNTDIKLITKLLESYDYEVINITNLKSDLEDIREYCLRCSTDTSNIKVDYNKAFSDIQNVLEGLK